VIYMGMRGLDAIASGLLDALPAATPAAVVQHASGAAERLVATTLGALAATVRRERVGSPAVVIVGDVVRGAGAWRAGSDAAPAAPVSARA
jgi:uroporphyrin-III C-methyltransferase